MLLFNTANTTNTIRVTLSEEGVLGTLVLKLKKNGTEAVSINLGSDQSTVPDRINKYVVNTSALPSDKGIYEYCIYSNGNLIEKGVAKLI